MNSSTTSNTAMAILAPGAHFGFSKVFYTQEQKKWVIGDVHIMFHSVNVFQWTFPEASLF